MLKHEQDIAKLCAALEEIKQLCVGIYMGRNWHTLSHSEQRVVQLLEKSGHLEPSKHGAVGWPPKQG